MDYRRVAIAVWGGGIQILALYTHLTRGFQNIYPKKDLPFWGKTPLNKNTAQFCIQFYPLNKIVWKHILWNRRVRKVTPKGPLIESKNDSYFFLKTVTFWPSLWFLQIAFSLKKQNLSLRFSGHACVQHYSLIAFDERVTFWLQHVRSLPCACSYVALFVHRFAYNHYAIAHAYNAANTHAQGSDPACWSQKSHSLVEGNRSIVFECPQGPL